MLSKNGAEMISNKNGVEIISKSEGITIITMITRFRFTLRTSENENPALETIALADGRKGDPLHKC